MSEALIMRQKCTVNTYKHDTHCSHLYGIKVHKFYPYHINADTSVPSINPILPSFMCKT